MKQEKRFFIASRDVALMDIKPGAKAVYMALCAYAGDKEECWPGIDLLQSDLGMDERTLRKHMDTLVQRGIIRKRRMTKNGLKNANRYTITDGLNRREK